jgi:hypothetical protein
MRLMNTFHYAVEDYYKGSMWKHNNIGAQRETSIRYAEARTFEGEKDPAGSPQLFH